MELEIPSAVAMAFVKEYPKHQAVTKESYARSEVRYVETGEFSDAQLGVMRSIARDLYTDETSPPTSKMKKVLKELVRDLDSVIDLAEMADREDVPTKATFRHLLPVFEAWLTRTATRGWVVRHRHVLEDGPWLYTGGQYHDMQRSQYGNTPEHWTLSLGRMFRGRVEVDSFTVWGDAVRGAKTFLAICQGLDIVPASPEFVAEYDVQQVRYEKHRALIGEQYVGARVNVGVYVESWHSRSGDGEATELGSKTTNLSTGGRPTRMVVDDDVAFAASKRDAKLPHGYEDAEVPNAQIIRCFSMDHHHALAVPVRAMTEYPYDATVGDKLVLPDSVRKLVHTLLAASLDGSSSVSDVVRNKMGGTTILSHGAPGTGKTLTAEVFAETLKRPLYVVQCSQLGIDVDTIEQNLNKVLRRAEKWKAILLLDEADVYVMERGSNIEQNAIVGVFLRVMEYFDGILVLTTNRGSLVDDAIRSRCIAEIEYTIPLPAARPQLWSILGQHYGLTLGAAEVGVLAKKFPNFSGRDIKQLCRLVRVNAKGVTGKKLLAAFDTFAVFKPGKAHG